MDVELTPEEKSERIRKMRRIREVTASRGGRKVIDKITKGTLYWLEFLHLTLFKDKRVNHLALERAMKAKAADRMLASVRKHG